MEGTVAPAGTVFKPFSFFAAQNGGRAVSSPPGRRGAHSGGGLSENASCCREEEGCRKRCRNNGVPEKGKARERENPRVCLCWMKKNPPSAEARSAEGLEKRMRISCRECGRNRIPDAIPRAPVPLSYFLRAGGAFGVGGGKTFTPSMLSLTAPSGVTMKESRISLFFLQS